MFIKNDSSFFCVNCNAFVSELKTSSRNHCNKCLYSLHVDINPGDRANSCNGILKPIGITINSKKGYVIEYKCKKCGAVVNNKAARDDNFEEMLRIMRNEE